jgi:hypothetical protein
MLGSFLRGASELCGGGETFFSVARADAIPPTSAGHNIERVWARRTAIGHYHVYARERDSLTEMAMSPESADFKVHRRQKIFIGTFTGQEVKRGIQLLKTPFDFGLPHGHHPNFEDRIPRYVEAITAVLKGSAARPVFQAVGKEAQPASDPA